jgi:hypothetical protein
LVVASLVAGTSAGDSAGDSAVAELSGAALSFRDGVPPHAASRSDIEKTKHVSAKNFGSCLIFVREWKKRFVMEDSLI